MEPRTRVLEAGAVLYAGAVPEAGARLASAGSTSPLAGAVPSLMAWVLAALAELFLQPIKQTASKAEALMSPSVRTIVRFLIVVQTPSRLKSFSCLPRKLVRCRELGWRLFAANILREKGAEDNAKGERVGVKFHACTVASSKCARLT